MKAGGERPSGLGPLKAQQPDAPEPLICENNSELPAARAALKYITHRVFHTLFFGSATFFFFFFVTLLFHEHVEVKRDEQEKHNTSAQRGGKDVR